MGFNKNESTNIGRHRKVRSNDSSWMTAARELN